MHPSLCLSLDKSALPASYRCALSVSHQISLVHSTLISTLVHACMHVNVCLWVHCYGHLSSVEFVCVSMFF